MSFAGDGPRTHVYSVLKTKTSLGALFALLLGLTPLTALARETEGTIVSVQLTDVLVDLGTTSGVETGDILDVWRPIVVKHPVTKQVIHDRFRIARLRVVQARPALSITRLEGETEHPLAAGDVVVATNGLSGALSATTLPAPPPPALPTPSAATTTTTTTSAESMSTDGRELDALFTSLRGAPPARRIAAYERWVAEHPKNRHVQVVTDEAIVLRRLGEAKKATSDPDPDPALARRLDEPHTRAYRPVRVARANEPLRIAIELAKTRGAVFNVRREGEAGFTTSPMTDMGKGYFGITLLPGTMRPDNLEYFIEAIDPSGGKAVAVSGSAASPLAISVEDVVPLDTHREPLLVTASVLTDYASFNATKGNDYVWQSEAMLGVRFGDVGLRALRSGFGAYRGKGGTLEDLDTLKLDARGVGLTTVISRPRSASPATSRWRAAPSSDCAKRA